MEGGNVEAGVLAKRSTESRAVAQGESPRLIDGSGVVDGVN